MRTFRIALRTLLRRPSFTLVVLLTLALGVGATSAIFTVVEAVLLRPLPYPRAGELVRVQHPVAKLNPDWRWGVSEGGFWTFREANRTLSGLAVYERAEVVLGGGSRPEKVPAAVVSANIFELLGARPAAGRLLRWEDNDPGAPFVVVLSWDLWQRQFDGDPGAVGEVLRLEGNSAEIVGVLERGFDLPDDRTSVWGAVRISPDNRPTNWHRFNAIARLASGVTPAAAEADLTRIIGTFAERLPTAYGNGFMEESGFAVEVVPLQEHVVGGIRTALWVLMGAVAIVLLIGCVNVANLFLVRLEAGQRERAVRTALGASRWDLARQSLAETLLLGLAAGGMGLLLAAASVDLLVRWGPDLPRLEEIGVNATVVAFTLAVAVVSASVFGLAPAAPMRVRFQALREGVGLTASRRRNTLRSTLVVAQMALALVLLVGAGLMVRTFENLRSVDPGIDPEGVLAVDISLPAAVYQDYEAVAGFYRDLGERTHRLPGVASAGATAHLPFGGSNMLNCSAIFVEDPEARERASGCFASTVQATPGYFETLGIDVAGRTPTWEDVAAGRGGIVVTRALAERIWPDRDPMGAGLRGNGAEPPYYRIEGIATDIRANGLDQPPIAEVYFPMIPLEGAPLWSPPRSMTLVVRSASGRAETLAAPVHALIGEIEPDAAIGATRTMNSVVAASMARTSFALLLLAVAAAVALALGVIGLYGVVSYVVEQRRPEIGIRMALGARQSEVRGMVIAQAARVAAIGILVGGVVALGAARALTSQLYGVAPTDPLTFAATAVLLAAVALAAAAIPARRAARIEPMRVLRGE